MAKYAYQPLTGKPGARSIRLIELQPGVDNDPIKCNITHASLDDNPEYCAISYCWGDASDPVSISCNPEGNTLAITKNLNEALRNFRYPYASQLLWADSICINQADLDERRDQVMLMGDIYRSAQRVQIWLGLPPEKPKRKPDIRLFDFISQIAYADSEVPFDAPPVVRMVLSLRSLNKEHFEAMEWVTSREYFRRAWILQEVALAQCPLLYCGSDSLPWDTFMEAFGLLMDAGVAHLVAPLGTEFALAIESTRETVTSVEEGGKEETGEGKEKRESMLSLLVLHRWRLATDPRDKIYSLLGLAKDSGPAGLNLRPDYSLSIAAAYERLARTLLDANGNLDVITVAGIPREQPGAPDGLPSWVPDWSSTERRSPFALRGRFLGIEKSAFRAAGDSTWTTASAEATTGVSTAIGGQLGVQAQILDTIGELGRAMRPEFGVTEYSPSYTKLLDSLYYEDTIFGEWEKLCGARLTGKTYAATGEPLFDAYWQTLIAGYLEDPHDGDENHVKLSKRGSAFDAKKRQFLAFDRYKRKARTLARIKHKLATGKVAFFSKPARLCLALTLILAMIFFAPKSAPATVNTGTAGSIRFRLPDQTETRDIANDIALASANRRFVVSKGRNLIGMVPASAQLGDRICLLKGCSVPLLLRPCSGDGGDQKQWKLVGECYFHGVMNGELYNEAKCEPIWLS
ncbi:uncharacterized protein Z519_04582 [Cladophialophora bantiana CBS 173.52]|uniref:Heterokaryon incompatibility domain-containing protein n=1 Tax=Cladophialophora bantiana (strain ATCC 10958 / CBS 173.52 / CDC B-1940 / NIH 8579) TaxID=1442370 RepID=A0A0D2EXG5_CLAB1|nr:uncharacterized protein Z519_04582 [Cladophialophora bantiana CBS 173.52]KIW94606.1 hypothetical protein Z519_04582 [Cladophialophora bantiana CBS 173.52]